MTRNEDDLIMRSLAGLTAPALSRESVERMRSRCHAALAQHRWRPGSPRREHLLVAGFVDAMLLFALAAYLVGAVGEAIRLGSLL
jgi:hypothetical protein